MNMLNNLPVQAGASKLCAVKPDLDIDVLATGFEAVFEFGMMITYVVTSSAAQNEVVLSLCHPSTGFISRPLQASRSTDRY